MRGILLRLASVQRFVQLTGIIVSFYCLGCDGRPSGLPTRTWTKPCDNCIAGVENFTKVSPTLWRGGQPTDDGFRNLEAAGAKTIVSLRDRHDDLPQLAGTKLKYLRVPAHAWDPKDAQIILVLRILQDPKNWPVFVHCAEGRDRTGYVVATYRMIIENWPADDAILEMFDFRFNTIWFRNPAFLRDLNVEKMHQLVKLAP
jgi:tyrosine-protein phosphatase SIW14